MRKKRLLYNAGSSLMYQIASIVCGFIIPRFILRNYGSSINGIVISIAQFLQLIAFLELGVGAVVQSSLYKPLVENDSNTISKIIVSANIFYRKIAEILLLYIVVLIIVFPNLVNNKFDWIFSGTLIVAISISYLAQYYLGITDRLLLIADQHGYVTYLIQTITIILNTVSSVILMVFGTSIQIVKLVSSLIFLLRPFLIRIYINKYYCINRNINYIDEPIKQKWNGMMQHIAAVILECTDIIILTMLSSLENVSIYSVYFLIVSGVKQLFMSLISGVQSVLGEMWASKDKKVTKFFDCIEWGVHTGTTFIYSCMCVLIVPFIKIYTSGISDANYEQPLFAYLLVLANAGHCLRLPYNIMILAAGHYKQTQFNYVIASFINIFISIICVYRFGLIGVASGTLIAMLFQTIWMAWYSSKFLIIRSYIKFWRQLMIDIITIGTIFWITRNFQYNVLSYIEWIVLAFKVTFTSLVTVLLINSVFKLKEIKSFYNVVIRKRF